MTTSSGLTIEWTPARQAASEAYATIANRRFEAGEMAFARALELAQKENWKDGDIAGLYGGRARVRLQLGLFPQAFEDIQKAVADEKGLNLANARMIEVEIARAMGDFRTATDVLATLRPEHFVSAHDRESGNTERIQQAMHWAGVQIHVAEARNRRAWGDLLGAREMFEDVFASLNAGNQSVLELQEILNIRRDYARILLALDEPGRALEEAHTALYQSLTLRGLSRRRPREQWVARGDVEVLAGLIVAAECAAGIGDYGVADTHFDTAEQLARRLNLPDDWRLVQLRQMDTWMIAADNRASSVTVEQLVPLAAALEESSQTRVRIEGLTLVGKLLFQQGHSDLAITVLERAIENVERVRSSASFEDRRDFLALQADSYRRLITACIRTDRHLQALFAAESLKSRQLIEMLDPGAETESGIERMESLREFQRRLPADVAAVNYANADWSETPPVAIVVTHDRVRGVELPVGRLRLEIALLPVERILEAQNREVDVNRYGRSETVTLAGVIAFYREAMTCPMDQIPERAQDILAVSPVLHSILIDPALELAGERRRLLLSPNGLLNYLPFDTLISQRGNFLINTHAITWTPSFLTTMTLARRSIAEYERPLLAFGGAVYDPSNYTEVMSNVVALREQLRLMRAMRESVAANTRSPYYGIFGGPSTNLAGTQAEVEELGELLPGSKIITGRQVSEANVRRLSAEGQLRTAQVVHFAVHGTALPTMPELSCLSLSYEGHFTSDMPAEQDGKLSLAEIRNLNLRADLVTLSACQTGLGAIFAGEGVVGLTSAFLIAGGDRVLSSLWPVNDVSTTFFMVEFYRRHFVNGEPGDLAMAAVKRDFIAGNPQGFRHPQFWAPFNLYGGADLLEL